jgi:hypothetical protein
MSTVRVVVEGLEAGRFAEVEEILPGKFQFIQWLTGPEHEEERKKEKVEALFLPRLAYQYPNFTILQQETK